MLSTIPSSQTENKKSKSNNSFEKETLSTSTAIAEDSSGGVGSDVLMNNEESKPNVEKRQRLRDVSTRSTIFTNKQTNNIFVHFLTSIH